MKAITKANQITAASKRNNGTTHMAGFELFATIKESNGDTWTRSFKSADAMGQFIMENPEITITKTGIRELWAMN